MKRKYLTKLIKEEIKKSLAEAQYGDIKVIPTTGTQRGTSDSSGGARSFAIILGNPGVYRKMEQTPMGKPGKMKAFKYDGPSGDIYREFEWDADTTQWEVWQRMNYIILTPDNEVHWYHGKMPGGAFKDDEGKLLPGSTGTPLPDLKIKGFGIKVYKALLLEPNVGYIVSSGEASPAVKSAVYSKLMKDKNFVWIATNGDDVSTYKNIIIINPQYSNIDQIKKKFEKDHKGSDFYYSSNFPNK